MKTYQVVLIKSYLVTVKAESEEVRDICEFYTSDIIQDISSQQNRDAENFVIEEIECTNNKADNCEEIKEEEE